MDKEEEEGSECAITESAADYRKRERGRKEEEDEIFKVL